MFPRRLGLFVSGFRWSGSSAVSDWLNRYHQLERPEGTDEAYGEIRALNYGAQKLLLVAEQKVIFGERLARWALYPSPRRWAEIFGPSFYRSRGLKGHVHKLADAFLLSLVKRRLHPVLDAYRPMLEAQLGADALEHDLYIQRVSEFSNALRDYLDARTGCVDRDARVADALSNLFVLFYDHANSRGLIPLFDNAVAGANAKYYHLLTTEAFDKQIIYLVYRDPRDQFAELVRHSVSTLSIMVASFIRDYRSNVAGAQALADEFRFDERRFVRMLSFEEFVCNEGLRSDLAGEIEVIMDKFHVSTAQSNGDFSADRSRRNIGIWKHAKLDRQMNSIASELGQYLRPEAD